MSLSITHLRCCYFFLSIPSYLAFLLFRAKWGVLLSLRELPYRALQCSKEMFHYSFSFLSFLLQCNAVTNVTLMSSMFLLFNHSFLPLPYSRRFFSPCSSSTCRRSCFPFPTSIISYRIGSSSSYFLSIFAFYPCTEVPFFRFPYSCNR